ncbi:MAG TPA: ADP-ribosylglycohydrolase family protein [Acidobacteriota bacterium]|nr:ADP-ribosylglycohydrolase family protein [Acidobacteriota bacterium]
MKTFVSALVATTILLIAAGCAFAAEKDAPRRISLQVLEDKIRGGWAGQMIGVSYGAPTEFRSNGKINEGPITWAPERVSNSIQQDDLYVEMTFAEVMDTKGLDATSEDFGEMFKNSKYSLWHANAAARRLLNNGIKAPLSGDPRYNAHANDIDFQIESDFIGLMTPGLPRDANKYADRVGRVMNYGDGLYGGMFFAGMYSAAFVESDVRRVVEQGLSCIPSKSRYGKIIRDVLDWHGKNPTDWKKTWQLIEDKWDKDDPCPDGALEPFNIDASINGAYVVLGLLYGDKDFGKTVEIAARAGQDSDCNPSSAAGILGVMIGYDKIPDFWKGGIPKLADTKFEFTNYSFNTICKSTLNRALENIRRAGGKVEGTETVIPYQQPQAPRLEQWDPGIPDKRVAFDNSSWTFRGNWSDVSQGGSNPKVVGKSAAGAGAEAELKFDGVAVILVGRYSQSGGRADVFLDSTKVGEINAYIVERTNDNALWHTYGLKPGMHILRIVARDDSDPRSKGKVLSISSAVTFRAR